jgi:lipopolysaccharide biosynthesis glycosyltransferase
VLKTLQEDGLYYRPTQVSSDGKMYDEISEHPMSTEFANSRFLAPEVTKRTFRHSREWDRFGWVLFMDCDVLVRKPLTSLFEIIEDHPEKAVFCVHHDYQPRGGLKMDGVVQTRYNRKNWSSVMALNIDHPSNRDLTVKLVNTVPGRELHAFCWLKDEEIGELDPAWNWLVGHSNPEIKPNIVHFTEGGPWFDAYKDVPYADEWLAALLY